MKQSNLINKTMKTGTEIKLSFVLLNIACWFTKPIITIKGKESGKYERKWGTHFFELPVGEYKIEIFVPNLKIANEYSVQIKENEIKHINFFANPLKAKI